LIAFRIKKLKQLQEFNVEPYAFYYKRTHYSEDIISSFDKDGSKLSSVSISGRIMSLRNMGKSQFADVMDTKGRIQIYLRKDTIGEFEYNLFNLLDIGDFIGVKGSVFRTKSGEISIRVEKFQVLSKALRPIPIVKQQETEGGEIKLYDQFSDIELRYRQRYIDLIVNPEVKSVFVKRTRIISSMRNFLDKQGFLEVETPILQPLYGGAMARPFKTHHHTLDTNFYLRIANELYLKRLIVGGFDRVYEIGKDFRNEGIDRTHYPEFTQMEAYVAYKDYYWLMEMTEVMIAQIAQDLLGTTRIKYQGNEIDLSPPWQRLPIVDAIQEKTGENIMELDENGLRKISKKWKVNVEDTIGWGKIVDQLFSDLIQPGLIQPTFVMDHPIEISPLAKKHREKEGLVERFEPVIGGNEIGNAFSELNDPIDQRKRFERQMEFRAKGDEEAQILDDDYIRALEYGMPPTAGIGIGIDRLTMILTNANSIRDVILFPQMKPVHKDKR